MSEIVLNLKGISKSYENNKVLRSIDFSVPEGTIMGLVGKNGAGKTTMIKCLLGLIRPDRGEAEVYGEPSWNLSVKTKHRIGYVAQTDSNFRWMKVRSMLEYTGAFYSHWNTQKVDTLLKEWDLDPYAKIGNLRRPGGFFSRKPPPWTPRKSFWLFYRAYLALKRRRFQNREF